MGGIAILTSIALKKLFCTVSYMYIKILVCNLDLSHDFGEKKSQNMPPWRKY